MDFFKKVVNLVNAEDRIDFDEVPFEDISDEPSNYEGDSESYAPEGVNPQASHSNRTKNKKVVGMPGISNGVAEVVIIEPHSFEEMPKVIETLRQRRSVVLNLNIMEPSEAQRAVDFVAGGTYAMDGHQERIGESIFLFTPNCVKVSTLAGVVHDVVEPDTVHRRNAPVESNWSANTTAIGL